MGLCPGSASMPDGARKHMHFGEAGASLGKRGSEFKVYKGLLKCPCPF